MIPDPITLELATTTRHSYDEWHAALRTCAIANIAAEDVIELAKTGWTPRMFYNLAALRLMNVERAF